MKRLPAPDIWTAIAVAVSSMAGVLLPEPKPAPRHPRRPVADGWRTDLAALRGDCTRATGYGRVDR